MKTLRDASIGETVKVVKLHGEGPVKRRIMDMGITKGIEVSVRKVAPLGDPIEVTVRGYELSLRKAVYTPSTMPMASAKIPAVSASSSVAGRRSAMMSATGRLSR